MEVHKSIHVKRCLLRDAHKDIKDAVAEKKGGGLLASKLLYLDTILGMILP
jgi:hypothetical protein